MWHFVSGRGSYGIKSLQTRISPKGKDKGIYLCLTMVPSESSVIKIAKSEQGCKSEPCLAFISVVLRAGCESFVWSPYTEKCIFDGVKAITPLKYFPVTLALSLHCAVLVISPGVREMCRAVSRYLFPYFCHWYVLGFCLYR